MVKTLRHGRKIGVHLHVQHRISTGAGIQLVDPVFSHYFKRVFIIIEKTLKSI